MIVEKEREASKLQKYLEDDKRKIGPLEQELQNVHRCEPDVTHALPPVEMGKLLRSMLSPQFEPDVEPVQFCCGLFSGSLLLLWETATMVSF